jgi:hypothetical protein
LVGVVDTPVVISHKDGLETNMVTLVSTWFDIAVGLLQLGYD